MRIRIARIMFVACLGLFGAFPARPETTETTAYPSLQAAIDANPGKVVYVPPGDYVIDKALRITEDNTGLCGYGRVIQIDPAEHIVEIWRAGAEVAGVRIVNLTLTRTDGAQETHCHGILANNCVDLDITGVRVIDNWSNAGNIRLQQCRTSSVRGCTVTNYKRIAVDDRTESDLYGYAFRVIDGTGILVTQSTGIMVQENRVVERRLFPTQDVKDRHQLGQFTDGKRPMKKGPLAPRGTYANNWHQGSAIVVTSPEETDQILVTGNYIENAAQGIDIHADHLTCSQNVIKYAFIGIKCMHGARNVIISGNNISHYDLWGIVMIPGTASHPAEAATEEHAARGANYTRGNIIANNILSDFGFGHEYYNWVEGTGRAISLESGQLPENPIMADVLIQGNIVYDTCKEGVLENGVPVAGTPRYEFAVYITPEPRPQNLHFANNIFHPGSEGVSNLPLTP